MENEAQRQYEQAQRDEKLRQQQRDEKQAPGIDPVAAHDLDLKQAHQDACQRADDMISATQAAILHSGTGEPQRARWEALLSWLFERKKEMPPR